MIAKIIGTSTTNKKMENNRNNLSSSSDKKSQAVAGQGKKEQKYKTDGGKTKSNAIEIPSISLPKGGGAIKGIDQKFSVNAVNGTSSFSIPLPISKARGAVPQLNLSYNSGGGNGIFGLGWSLGLPSIKRKTDKKLPILPFLAGPYVFTNLVLRVYSHV